MKAVWLFAITIAVALAVALVVSVTLRATAPASTTGPDDRYGVAVHGGLDQEAEYFLDSLGVSSYLNFTADMSDVPDTVEKLPHIGKTSPGSLLSPGEIEALVQSAAAGSHWYVGSQPNVRGISGAAFADVFHHYYTNIKAADPTAKVSGPGMLNWDFTCIGCGGFPSGESWLRDFINAYESKYGQPVPVGAWAIDVFPIDWNNTPNNDPDRPAMYNGFPTQHWRIAVDQLERMRQDLDAMGYADTPIWVTDMAVHIGYETWR